MLYLLAGLTPVSLHSASLCLLYLFLIEVQLCHLSCHFHFHGISFFVSCFQSVCILTPKGNFLQVAYRYLFLNPFNHFMWFLIGEFCPFMFKVIIDRVYLLQFCPSFSGCVYSSSLLLLSSLVV